MGGLVGVQLVRQEIRRLLEAGEITGEDALMLTVFPTAGLLEARRAKGWSPELRAECVRLHEEDGLSCRQVAERTGVSFTTVKSWLWSAGFQAVRLSWDS